MRKLDKSVNINSKGRVLRVVREQYLRDDIPCCSPLCTACASFKANYVLNPHANYYVLPASNTLINYLEIFEQIDFRNVIYLQTVVNKVLHSSGGRRNFNKIKNILKLNDRNHVFFPNEHHVDTSNADVKFHDEMDSVFKVATWYINHLNKKISVIILTENENFKQSFGVKDENIFILSVHDYLRTFMAENLETLALFESLQESIENVSTSDSTSLYKEYFKTSLYESGLQTGKLLTGVLKVNRFRSSDEANVTTVLSTLLTEVHVYGMSNRNRAIHNDEVVIELLPKNQWKAHARTIGDEETNDSKDGSENAVPCGKVVAILQRNWRDYVASINVSNDSNFKNIGTRFLAVPYDRRIPKIRISTRQIDKLKNKRIIVRIDSWPTNSQYPNGHFVKDIGSFGDAGTETATILTEYGISTLPFSESIMAELPSSEEPWLPSEEEIKNRKDIRSSHLTFSVDPIGCEDVDDTVSIKFLDDGFVELAVNIADVTHFVPAGSLTDIEARTRATTVYMADRRFDMLPGILSGNICSLLSGVDRYAVSVIWTIDKNYGIVNVWYGRTVIHSKYKLSYEVAHSIVNGKPYNELITDAPELNDYNDFTQLKKCLLYVTDVSRKFRSKRLQDGGLELESTEVQFELTDQNVDDMKTKDSLEIHDTVAELMILANSWVAQHLLKFCPHNALLRRHPSPNRDSLINLKEIAQIKNFAINTESNATFAESLNKCIDPNDPHVNATLRKMSVLAMCKALYFSTGSAATDQFTHYGLALNHYTHFTSPIRRYADVIVHRQLLQSLTCSNSTLYSNVTLQEICDHMNEKSIAAQQAQRASQLLFQVRYFHQKAMNDQFFEADSIITAIRSNGVIIDVPIYGLDGAVYLQNKDKQVPFFDGDTLSWIEGSLDAKKHSITVETLKGNHTYTIFDHITVRIEPLYSKNNAHADKLSFVLVKNRSCDDLLAVDFKADQVYSPPMNMNSDSSVSEKAPKAKCSPTFYQMFSDMENLALGV